MTIEVQIAAKAQDIPTQAQFLHCAQCALDALKRSEADLCIRIVDAAESQTLNQQYRQINKPTNVLSFPADVAVEEVDLLGDLVICAPIVASEAQDQAKESAHHYAHMVVHGVLHLAGFDHEQEQDAQVMETLEVEILRSLGIGDPYQ